MGTARRVKWINWARSWVARRRYYALLAGVLLVAVVVLLALWRTSEGDNKDLTLNLGSELIGTVIVLFVITPFLARADRKVDAILARFDHDAFIRQAADAKEHIRILELWTDLLQAEFQRRFLAAVGEALSVNAEVRILLLDPDSRAAQQREDDLQHRIDVDDSILQNLRTLHEFQTKWGGHRIDIRVYRAMPSVQMYQVDDHMLVSFYPTKVTSWDSTQYQTGPTAHLGIFVDTKFEELWTADSTRTLEQLWTVVLEDEGNGRQHSLPFVSIGGSMYVGGLKVDSKNLRSIMDGQPFKVVENDTDKKRPCSLKPLEPTAEAETAVQELFTRKYGAKHQDLIFELVPLSG
ncbi:hypothetical protein EV193_11021 [Herbihabitans rhizosphaerae]|uniref:Uncharacterized protein n=1 Tax=Herbihabitans rhizosphaerae TaxID=1872711 RepID=A0A4Q7KGA1_9PSEU|nr:hypothetical protein [Herbihabitans rhizosphaerae]RZS33871.1 hypothetical protein EV193_11021 [Herbihabitans rhizosphaerae]